MVLLPDDAPTDPGSSSTSGGSPGDEAYPATAGQSVVEAASRDTVREIVGWLEFGEAARELAQDVLASGFRPDVVVAIARGGLVLAGAISYALDTKMCGSINVE
ncbi:MAG: phosphoribosyltransferase, partial [Frondihabitans sp.]|nr:phosphoribosyltransferase [Frondihabitans sp.]